VPLPCDVERVAITYLARRDGAFVPVTRTAPVRQLLPLIDNTLAFDTADVVTKPIRGLLSGVEACSCLSFLRTFLPLAPPHLLLRSQKAQARHVTEQTFRVTVTSFCDRFNFEQRAARRECVHVITPDGLRIPFSTYNTIHRWRGARALA